MEQLQLTPHYLKFSNIVSFNVIEIFIIKFWQSVWFQEEKSDAVMQSKLF